MPGMYGYGANHNKLIKSAREKIPGFFVPFPGVTGHGNTGTGQKGRGNTDTGQKGNRNGIYSRALRKLQRKPCKNMSKNGNFTLFAKIFA